MKLTFLGTGSFFSTDNYHTNILLEHDGKTFLIDCGTDIKHSLESAHKTPNINAVYISHMHGDHVGGLEYLGYYAYFVSQKKLDLYIPQELECPVWNSVSSSMAYLDDIDADLSTYFNVHTVNHYMNQDKFMWNGIEFKKVSSRHIVPNDHELRTRRPIQSVLSYGLQFVAGGKKIWITTDSCEANFAEKENWWNGLSKYGFNAGPYCSSDIIFHDCETFECSNVHSHYSALKKFPYEIKKKIWLVHYQNLEDKMPDAKADGFAGFVKKGQVFDF